MVDLPKHLIIGVDEYGQGPASAEDTVRFVCWCNQASCDGPDPTNSDELMYDDEEE
jgi:hypothetical protein